MPHAFLRTSYRPGHLRRMLVFVDGSVESEAALYFCGSRIAHSSGEIVLLYVVEALAIQNFPGVRNVHLDEQTAKAKALFRMSRTKLNMAGYENVVAHEVIRDGKISDVIVQLVQDESDVGIHVLGAAVDSKGPGPLVSALATKMAGSFPIPITIVPGDLKLEEFHALA